MVSGASPAAGGDALAGVAQVGGKDHRLPLLQLEHLNE